MTEILPPAPVESKAVSKRTRTQAAPSLLGIIARAASDASVDVDKMAALLAMHERILAKEAEVAFNAALARLDAHLPRVRKNGTVDLGNGKGSYPFAKWEDIDSIIRPLMRREGFVLTFTAEERAAGGALVVGTLLHSGGHSRQASVPLPPDPGPGRNAVQAMGSTLSYGKRYTAEMLLNIVREGEDDDGRRGVDGPAVLSRAQVEELNALMRNTRTLEAAFLKAMRPDVQRIEQAPAGDFVRLKNGLLAKARQMAKRAAETKRVNGDARV